MRHLTEPLALSLGIFGLDGFIGRHHMSAAGSVISPKIIVEACVPGKEKDYEDNIQLCLRMGFSKKSIYPTLEAMLASEHDILDGVIIASPNYLHAPQCIMVAEAGKHVICDKPLGTSAEDADAIVAAVEKTGVKSAVTTTYCGHPPMIEARERILKANRSYDIVGGRFVYDQRWLRMKLKDMKLENGLMQAEWRKYSSKSGKGGSVGDLVSHLIAQLIFMTGLKVVEVWASRRWVVEGEEGKADGMTDDQITCMLILENGAVITVESVQYAGGYQNDNEWALWMKDGWSYGWSQRTPEELWVTEGGPRIYLTRDDFQSPLLPATETMPSRHGDGWHDADGRILTSFAWEVLDYLPDGAELFHPDVHVGRNINAVIDALVESADADPPRQLVKVDWV